jgi:hypothetical protein
MDQPIFLEIMPISIFLPRQKRFDFFISYNKRGGAGIQKTKISVAASRHFDADPAFHFGADPDPNVHSDADPDPTFHFDADPDLDLATQSQIIWKLSSRLP